MGIPGSAGGGLARFPLWTVFTIPARPALSLLKHQFVDKAQDPRARSETAWPRRRVTW